MAWQKREKMPRYDRTCDRKELIRRSLDVFLQKRGMTLWVDGCAQSRNDSFGARGGNLFHVCKFAKPQ